MKTSKIIIGILSILIGIIALIESYDVFRLASSFGVNGFHIYVGFIVGFIFICIGISSLMMMHKQSKQYAETTLSLSSVAIFLCFRGPELFTDLLFFAIWGAICFIFAIFAYYSAKKHDEREEYNQLVNQSICPYCNAVVDESTMFCSSCGKKIKRNCPHCGALIMVNRTFCSNCKKKIDDEVSFVTFDSQKKCPQCGASINEGVAFCSECGCKIPKGNVCSHCGAPVSNDDVFCKNCGNKVCDDCESSTNTQAIQIRKCNHCGVELNNDDAFCPNCGAKIVGATAAFSYAEPQQRINANDNSSDDNNSRGYLYIRWDGKWALIDYKVQILVNGIMQGEYSFKDGFEVVVPISSPEMLVETKMSFHKTKKVLSLNPQENYSYNLVYNTVSGSFGFVLCDNDGNELETDKLHWGYFLLCFLIPIVGFIYALSIRKKKPATSNQALMVSLLGFVVSLILSYSLPVAISRYNEIKEAKLAREKFVKDSLEQVRKDSIKLVEQKEIARKDSLEKARIQLIQQPYLALLDKYGSQDDNWGQLYFLFDITGDGLPEIWMNIMEGENYKFCVYSCQNGNAKLLFKDELGFNCSFYQGDNYILMGYAHMGYQVINKFVLDKDIIKKEKIYETEEDTSMEEAEYKEIEEPLITTYEITDKNPIYEIK